MVTFDEFLIAYDDVVEEAYEDLGLTETAKEAVVTIMKKYLGNRRFDPLDLINLFQTVCYSAMHRGQLSRKRIEDKVSNEMENYFTEAGLEGDFTADSFPDREKKGL